MSNLDADYSAPSTDHLGTADKPDIDLPTALNRAKQLTAPYTTKSDGSNLVVRIVLYKGDHFMVRQNIEYEINAIDFYQANYELVLSPLYCDIALSDPTVCVNSTNGDSVTIYNKLAAFFTIDIPMKMTIEDLTWDMIEGFIPYQNDPGSCLSTRAKC